MDSLQDANPIERRLVHKANVAEIPISATLELLPVCNLHCDMCYIRMDRTEADKQGGLKSVEEWLHIASQLKELGTLFILLTGGEPLLYPHFRELYIRLKKMGFVLTINTNATLVTEETARLFKEYPPRRLNVTLYGASPETYRSVCHSSTGFDRCMAGLKLLKQYGIATKLTLTLIGKNRHDYPRMLQIARELEMPVTLNAYTSLYTRPHVDAHTLLSTRMSPEEAARIEMEHLKYTKAETYESYRKEMVEFLKLPLTSVPHGLPLTCRAGKSSCWINWQGVMTPCVDMDEPSARLSDMSVADAWRSIVARCKELPLHPECKGCTLKPVCDVCYANATNEKKHCGTLEYLCHMARMKKDFFRVI